jgi:hypothetical protein
MADITTIIRPELDLTERIVVGALTASDILDQIEQLQKVPFSKLRLWDFTDATFESIRSEDVPRFADAMARQAKLSFGWKTAVILGSDVAFGITRMYEAYREIRNISTPFYAARSRPEALEWLLRKEPKQSLPGG